MKSTVIHCAHCGTASEKPLGAVNRALRGGHRLFCNRTCSGLARREHKSREQKKAEKAAYDAEYRARNCAMLKAKKAAHHRATYDPESAAMERRLHRARHLEYCRRPEYRAWKKRYDREYRAGKEYGELAEVFLAVMSIYDEVNARMSRAELYASRGTQNKTQNRKRDYERTVSHRA